MARPPSSAAKRWRAHNWSPKLLGEMHQLRKDILKGADLNTVADGRVGFHHAPHQQPPAQAHRHENTKRNTLRQTP